MDDLESDSKSNDMPLVSPFLDSDEELDDGEVINELNEYVSAVIIEQRVKVNRKACILELKRRNHEEHYSDNLYVISVKKKLQKQLGNQLWRNTLLRPERILVLLGLRLRENARFELKGQFLKELHDNNFSGLDNEDANEHIEKVLKIVDLFHIPEVTQD
ncbi:hypothetical protein Tco_0522184 [Tanacetum coccineum]